MYIYCDATVYKKRERKNEKEKEKEKRASNIVS